MRCDVICGDTLERLAQLPYESVNCCVTSPPYWGLRDYGIDGQIGLEKSPEEYVTRMVQIFRAVRRVLRDDGTVWLNLGDSYAGGGNYRGLTSENTLTAKQSSNRGARGLSKQLGVAGKDVNLPSKNLIGIPWRVAFALQADGWWLRSDIIWSKPNPMPESVTDRPTKAHEYVFLLSKSQRYYYDADAIREPWTCDRDDMREKGIRTGLAYLGSAFDNSVKNGKSGNGQRQNGEIPDGRNKRSVWTIATAPYPEAHFATYPPDLVKPCILAGCPIGGVVLDPFAGSGTTGMVALELGRRAILIELNPEYVSLIHTRINAVTPGFF